jgi:hypothetical protein
MCGRFCVVFDNVAVRLGYDPRWKKVRPKTIWKVAAALCCLPRMGIAYNVTHTAESFALRAKKGTQNLEPRTPNPKGDKK